MKKSKKAYYNKYFETNWNNIKNTWKRNNLYDIANTFSSYFASIAKTTKKS